MARTTSPGGEREMDGVEKAATLLITLGPEKSPIAKGLIAVSITSTPASTAFR